MRAQTCPAVPTAPTTAGSPVPEGSGNYLELSAEEIELLKNLKALKDNGTFKSIVVLINSSNALEMDFLNPAHLRRGLRH